jgi:hypothetical protein
MGLGILFLFPFKSCIIALLGNKLKLIPDLGIFPRLFTDILILVLFWAGIAVLVSGGFAPGIYDKF